MNERSLLVLGLPWRMPSLAIAVLALALPAAAQVNVLTQHNDNQRTGANLNETVLTPSNVNVNQFGMLFKHSPGAAVADNVNTSTVDDQVYSQPLIATNINIGGGTHNVVFITTVANSVYAFDADKPGNSYWHRKFGAAVPAAAHFGCTDLNGNMSII